MKSDGFNISINNSYANNVHLVNFALSVRYNLRSIYLFVFNLILHYLNMVHTNVRTI